MKKLKKLQFYFLSFLLLVSALPAASQIVSKDQSKPSTDVSSAKDAQTPIDFRTSREEDIFVFESNMKMFQNAIDVKSVPEAELFLNRNIEIAAREIARAKNNLAELKSGDTKHLDQWRKGNGDTVSLNIDLEINRLNDNINSMEYRYKDLANVNIDNFSDPKTSNKWLGDMRIILKNMNKNLKYESDKKAIYVEQPSVNDTVSVGGTGIITQNQTDQKSESGNPMMNDFYTAQAARITQFKEQKSNYQSQLQASDYKSARRTYKSILQTMQSEIDANTWLKIQKDEESNKLATINVDKVSPKIAEQQNILDQAGKIKVPTAPTADFDAAKTLELIADFEKTFN